MIDLAELRARTPLLPLVQRHVRLKRTGHLWTGCCPFHAEKTPSFSVYPDHHYHCFGCGAHGDAIGFVRAIEGLTFPEAVSRLAAEAGLSAPRGNRQAQRDRTARLARERAERECKRAAEETAAIALARRLVSECVVPEGTPAGRYLTEVRGIAEPVIGWPEAIGWHPGERALIATATDAAGTVLTCQRIRLRPDGQNLRRNDGSKIKLNIKDAPRDGAAVRLPSTTDGPLLLAEGPETGLSLWAATGHEIWITLGRIGAAELPTNMARIIIVCADDDPPDHPAAIALAETVARWRAEGRKVAIAQPWAIPRGDKSDFNDVIRAAGPEAVRERIRSGILALHGLAPAAPPFALPTATVVDARAALIRFAREAFAPAAEGQLAPQILIAGEGGTGKTHAVGAHTPHAMLQAKTEGHPWRLIYGVPEHINLGPQITERFTKLGLNVFRLEGRGDPFNPTPRRKPRCQNLPAVGEAIMSGQSVREAVCGPAPDGSRCPFFDGCDHLADLRHAAKADVVVVAHNFIFEHLPKEVLHDVGWVVIDEDFTAHGDYIRGLTVETFAADALARFPVLHKGEPDKAETHKVEWLHGALLRFCARVADGYLPAEAIRAEGITPDDCADAARLNWRRKIDVGTTPGTDLQRRGERRREVAINRQLPTIAAIWHGIEAVLREGERGAGRIALSTRHSAKGSWREITVHAQRQVATWLADLPIIIVGATTGLGAVRRFFPRTELRSPPRVATPHAHHRLILGGFGKATLARHPKRQRQLRTWHEVQNMGRDQGIVTHLSAAAAFAGMADTRTTWHGANAGDDSFRAVEVLSVIGGMSARPAAIAQLAATRSGRAVSYARAIETTAAVLMRDGSGVAVPVLAYEDPDAQAVHRAIFNTSIEQAAARARAVERTAANPVEVNIFANVAPAMPIDEIVHWRDIKPDRLWDMLARRRVYENAAQMHAVYPDLFGTRRAATDARARFGDIRGRTRELAARDIEAWSEIAFQPTGQGQRVSRAWGRARDVDAMRADLEARFGEMVYFRALPFTPGQLGEVVRKPVYAASNDLRTTSWPAADPAPGAVKWGDQPRPDVFKIPDG